MTIQEGPDTAAEKAVKTRWPVEEGLIAGTTKQTGARSLRPEKGSIVPSRNKAGI